MFEWWNVGPCPDGNLGPSPAVLYERLARDRRALPSESHDTDQQWKANVNRFLQDLKDWPHRPSREEILFGHTGSLLNRHSCHWQTKQTKMEMRGLAVGPNLCHFVVASCADSGFQRVFVMSGGPRDVYYPVAHDEHRASFSWNSDEADSRVESCSF